MVSMQQQEEDARNNAPVQLKDHIWHDEDSLYASAKEDLSDEFLYRMVGLMKTEKMQLRVMNRCEDLYNLVADRNEQDYDGNIDPYGGATALFDVLGHRWPNDDYSDQKTGTMLEWLAFWSMFRHEVSQYFHRKGWNDAWVKLTLGHYRTGRHDT